MALIMAVGLPNFAHLFLTSFMTEPKNSPAAGSSVHLPASSKLNKFDHSYIAGKVLQIRLKIANYLQKNSPAAGSSVYFFQT